MLSTTFYCIMGGDKQTLFVRYQTENDGSRHEESWYLVCGMLNIANLLPGKKLGRGWKYYNVYKV